MTDHLTALAESQSSELGQSAAMREYISQLRSHKAVIIAHRGAAHQMLGNPIAAAADAREAKELGFNKATGVW